MENVQLRFGTCPFSKLERICARWGAGARLPGAVLPVSALHFGLRIEIEATSMV
jgi:hypothetical protein